MTFEKFMINHIAPTLCGIKAASMFTLRDNLFVRDLALRWQKMVRKHSIELEFFHTSENLVMFFSFNRGKIENILSCLEVRSYLTRKGFNLKNSFSEIMDELFSRLKNNAGFPHEVGIFLGYPLEDVILFEETGGKNCKFCGYWKSYSNIEEAKKLCCTFDNCRCMCKKWLDEGLSVSQIVRKYKKATRAA